MLRLLKKKKILFAMILLFYILHVNILKLLGIYFSPSGSKSFPFPFLQADHLDCDLHTSITSIFCCPPFKLAQ